MTSSAGISRFWLSIFCLLGLWSPASAETFSQQAGEFLTHPVVSGTLLTFGIVFLFMSVVTMGTGIAEICCFTSFAFLFGGRFLIGEDLWVPLALFAAGIVFAMVELFVMPGMGVFGILSIISFGGLSVLVMDNPQTGLGIFILSILLSMLSGYLLMKYLPRFVVTRKLLVLEPPEAGPKPVLAPTPLVAVGDKGQTVSTLRPIGTAMFGTQRMEVISEGDFLKKGETVEVIRVEAQKVVVRACQS
ncbi:MAG: NfeD family protein [Vulcanimicrobiota bacterium]